jgi:hypothetical protein
MAPLFPLWGSSASLAGNDLIGQEVTGVSVPVAKSVLPALFRFFEKAHPSHVVAMVTAASSVALFSFIASAGHFSADLDHI